MGLPSMARIMIAEDSDATRMVLKDSLHIGHHELVAEAKDGIEVMEKFNLIHPDVLLLDISMPKKDGVSVLQEIMSSDHEAKIIMITADENFNTIYKSTAEGAQAYIIKPFSFTDVLNAITMVLN